MLVHQNIAETADSGPPAPQDHLLYRQGAPHKPQAPTERESVSVAAFDNLGNALLQLIGQPLVGIELHRPRRGDRQFAHGEVPLVAEAAEPALYDVNTMG